LAWHQKPGPRAARKPFSRAIGQAWPPPKNGRAGPHTIAKEHKDSDDDDDDFARLPPKVRQALVKAVVDAMRQEGKLGVVREQDGKLVFEEETKCH
jgi:hypothetical protein